MAKILVTGANGQIGTELVAALVRSHGSDAVLATDLHDRATSNGTADCRYCRLDVADAARLRRIVEENEFELVFHLASLLSATGEEHPDRSWDINMNGLKHVLDLARECTYRVFWPSSIAVFGAGTPKENVPQHTVLDPSTMYGVTKVSGEMLCRYYALRFGVDVRSLRYPGLISYTTPPGGGTTDYAVEMFYAAIDESEYTCFVRPDTKLPMMYMPDAIRAVFELMEADAGRISVRTSYNINAATCTARQLERAIRRRIPGFSVDYDPDARQQIADSWPSSVDDAMAREDWGWSPEYDTARLVDDMLENLSSRSPLHA